LLAEPEQVQLFQLDAAGIRAAAAPERDAGIRRPDVAHRDFKVHRAVMTGDGVHRGLADIPPIAEIPFGLLDQSLRDRISGLEQELRLDHRIARVDVQAIGKPVERLVLALRVVIEDRQDVHFDRPDPVPELLELCDAGAGD
jgi:hypothetical protein